MELPATYLTNALLLDAPATIRAVLLGIVPSPIAR
jgi:hypothetical protein